MIALEGFDWNCPQHIAPRYSEAEVRAAVAPLLERLARTQAERDALRHRLDALSVALPPE